MRTHFTGNWNLLHADLAWFLLLNQTLWSHPPPLPFFYSHSTASSLLTGVNPPLTPGTTLSHDIAQILSTASLSSSFRGRPGSHQSGPHPRAALHCSQTVPNASASTPALEGHLPTPTVNILHHGKDCFKTMNKTRMSTLITSVHCCTEGST